MYNYCTNTQSQGNAARSQNSPKVKAGANNRQPNIHDGANIVGGELHARLKNHLKAYLEKICEVRLFNKLQYPS